MKNEPEPISMTVYPKPDGTWWFRLSDDLGNVKNKGPIAWNGEGGFYKQGLNFVLPWIPKGYAYQSWQEMGDSSYTTVVYRLHPGFSQNIGARLSEHPDAR
jgi:hypothetical protein